MDTDSKLWKNHFWSLLTDFKIDQYDTERKKKYLEHWHQYMRKANHMDGTEKFVWLSGYGNARLA